jgi:hypothetical protein
VDGQVGGDFDLDMDSSDAEDAVHDTERATSPQRVRRASLRTAPPVCGASLDDDTSVDAGYEHTAADFESTAGAPSQQVQAINPLQCGSRVSTLAKNFDNKQADRWSLATFGDGGTHVRVFGVVKELGSDGDGRQSNYRVKWDIAVPEHDPQRANNPRAIGRKWFTKVQLRREDPSAGRRRNDRLLGADITSPVDRPVLNANQPDEDNADDQPAINVSDADASFRDMNFDNSLEDGDDSDTDWDPAEDSGADEPDEDPDEDRAPAVDRDDLLAIKQSFTTSGGKFTFPGGSQDVEWHFAGMSEAALKAASLPWAISDPRIDSEGGAAYDIPDLVLGASNITPSMPPPLEQTKIAEKFDMATKVKEFDQFLVFYPGGVDDMLKHVKRVNEIATQHEDRMNHGQGWSNIDIWDWLSFLGILFGRTRYADMNWKELFDPGKADENEMFRGPNWSKIMAIGKFSRIRKWAHAAFASTDVSDPWGLFRPFVTEYNAHMMDLIENLRAYWIADETMSPFQPRADKFGGLANLSYIQRKPKPFGTEFKTVCTADGLMVFMEIQEGAVAMQKLHISGYGSKASMTQRLCENAAEGMVVIGDADFGSLTAAHALALTGKGCIMNVKTSKANFPKAVLEAELEGCAAGSYMALTTTVDGIRFNAIGYKYSRSKKVQTFICTVGAVTSGYKPYIAKFKDAQFNTISRPVRRPNVLSRAYELLNVVDKHNHGRQDLIHLETSWLTQNCYFRCFCTGMGIVAENTHRNNNNGRPAKKQLTHDIFLRNLAQQMTSVSELTLSNGKVIKRPAPRSGSPVGMSMSLVQVQTPGGAGGPRSMSPELATFDLQMHTVQKVAGSSGRRCVWCTRLHNSERRCEFECKECDLAFCDFNRTGRHCFKLHTKHGVPPSNMQKVNREIKRKWKHLKATDDEVQFMGGFAAKTKKMKSLKRKRKKKAAAAAAASSSSEEEEEEEDDSEDESEDGSEDDSEDDSDEDSSD